ncbi:hypothetical protein BKA70DRAFT_37496 [Coprinopsis sp. MPI-PUGE-AT-0042]|nr:hypothetical protein BKA70DRAFT_37496 [Coprinopsis sp. MPI-PUGE-AT-0042]
MAAQSPLASFDPFANHPFTNGSGLMPEAPYGSAYPMQFAAARAPKSYYPSPASSPAHSGSSTPSSRGQSTPLYSPQAHHGSSKPIFVPYSRSDASSPELVLRKKAAYNMVGK